MVDRAFAKRLAAHNRKMCAASMREALKPYKDEPVSEHFRVTLNGNHPDTAKRLTKLYKMGVPGSSVSIR